MKAYLNNLVFIVLLGCSHCFSGSFIVKNDFEGIMIRQNGFDSDSLSFSSEQYPYTGPTVLYYFEPENLEATYPIVELEDLFYDEGESYYKRIVDIGSDSLAVLYRIVITPCTEEGPCMLCEYGIQDVELEVISAELNRISLPKKRSLAEILEKRVRKRKEQSRIRQERLEFLRTTCAVEYPIYCRRYNRTHPWIHLNDLDFETIQNFYINCYERQPNPYEDGKPYQQN